MEFTEYMITLYIQSKRFFFGEKQGWGCEGWAAEARAITATSRLIHDQTILERNSGWSTIPLA
jgi:hypothetical protein